MINLEKLLYRIILGYYYIYIDNEKFKIVYPSINIKYEADILYDSIKEDNRFVKNLLTISEMDALLKKENIWDENKEKDLKKAEIDLENSKVLLFQNFFNKDSAKQARGMISAVTKAIIETTTIKNTFKHLTIEDYCLGIKNEFIIMNSIYNAQNTLVFNNPDADDHEYKKLQVFIKEILEQNIIAKNLRDLAKSELWKSYNNSSNIDQQGLDITDDLRHLINLSKMYENVRQHPESPDDNIIADDDALDGWFIYQNRKVIQEKKKTSILSKVRGNDNAGEVFILTNDKEETKEIIGLNDERTKKHIRGLSALVANGKSVDWCDVPYVQENLRAEMSEIIRKKK